MAAGVHVGGLFPLQVNALAASRGDLELVFDRKVESYLRLLVCLSVDQVDVGVILYAGGTRWSCRRVMERRTV